MERTRIGARSHWVVLGLCALAAACSSKPAPGSFDPELGTYAAFDATQSGGGKRLREVSLDLDDPKSLILASERAKQTANDSGRSGSALDAGSSATSPGDPGAIPGQIDTDVQTADCSSQELQLGRRLFAKGRLDGYRASAAAETRNADQRTWDVQVTVPNAISNTGHGSADCFVFSFPANTADRELGALRDYLGGLYDQHWKGGGRVAPDADAGTSGAQRDASMEEAAQRLESWRNECSTRR